MIDILRRTRCYVDSTTITLTAGTTDYQLDTGILAIRTLYATGSSSNMVLEQIGEEHLTELQLASSTESDPVTYYSLLGANLLSVWPPPASSTTITIRYVPRPTAMSGASDDPSTATYGGIPAEWHYGIELYALWKMADSIDDQSSSQGERYRVLYEGADGRGGYLAQIRAEMHRKAGPLPRARLRRPRRKVLRLWNDQR